jgi:hypothetical protein
MNLLLDMDNHQLLLGKTHVWTGRFVRKLSIPKIQGFIMLDCAVVCQTFGQNP